MKAMGIQKQMPVVAMIFTQFILVGSFLLSKAAISSGLKPSVFVAYRQAVATLVLAPFAVFCERKNSPPLTSYVLCKIFIVSSCGIPLTFNLFYVGLKYTSATSATALSNILPAIVFIIAVCSRIESLAINQREGMAKVLGTIVSAIGVTTYSLYKGPPLYSGSSKTEASNAITQPHTKEEWIKGSSLLVLANLTWAIWLVMQAPLLKQYPAKLRFSTMANGFSCITATVYSAIIERDISSWKLDWNVNLLSLAYSGILVTAVSYTIQVWVVEKRGPVFVAIFNPLALVLTAIFSALVFHEILHWGSVIGGVLVIAGLYIFFWGKNKEIQQKELDNFKDEVNLDIIVASTSSTKETKKQTPN